jgi:transposase
MYCLTEIVVYLVKKVIKGNTYLYLAKSARVDGKTKIIWQKYLGREESIEKQDLSFNFEDPDSYHMQEVDFGLPVALMQLVEKLDFVQIINFCTSKRNQGISVGEYMVLAVLQRSIKPRSKTQLESWFESSYLRKYFPPFKNYLDADAYSNHFRYLNDTILDEIEINLQKRIKSRFSVDYSNLYYDPTNFFTFINPKKPNQTLAKHGKSKENRHTLNLVAMSLICTDDGGIPLFHRVYPGNNQDAGHFKIRLPEILNQIEQMELDPANVTLIFDKGNISEEIFEQIDQSGLKYICSLRPSTQKDLDALTEKDFTLTELANGKPIGYKEYLREIHGKDRRLIVAFNPKKNNWSATIKKTKLSKKLEEVEEYFKKRLNVKKWRDPEKVKAKIESLIGKTSLPFFLIKVSGDFATVEYSIKLNENEVKHNTETLGKSYYVSNLDDAPEDIIYRYRQQYKVERLFKYIKHSEYIRVRPLYHRNDESIRGHIFVCVMALLLLTLLEREVNLKRSGNNISIGTIIDRLTEVKLIKVQSAKSKSLSKVIYKMVAISSEAQELVDLLGLEKYIP